MSYILMEDNHPRTTTSWNIYGLISLNKLTIDKSVGKKACASLDIDIGPLILK